LETYQREFIEFSLSTNVLKFGDFTLKSGRQSPYFFNAGLFSTGDALQRLGKFYATSIVNSGLNFDTLYGAAYKGIPLVCAIAIAMKTYYKRNYSWCFNRKEAKNHGEKGQLIGSDLRGKVLIVDDVISAGTSVRESIAIITAKMGVPVGLAVALDRQEKGQSNDDRSAMEEIQKDMGLETIKIVNLETLIAFLDKRGNMKDELLRTRAYLNRYGAKSNK